MIRKFFFAVLLTVMIAFYDVGTVVTVSDYSEYRVSEFFEGNIKQNNTRKGGKVSYGRAVAASYRGKSR